MTCSACSMFVIRLKNELPRVNSKCKFTEVYEGKVNAVNKGEKGHIQLR